jgi:hypothetical protein
MKRFLFVAALAVAAPLSFAADVGVSVSVGQPGFFGHIDIGNVPQPQLIYPQPVLIQQLPRGMAPQPIYLHVPPGHEKHWDKHCRKYNACGRPVYFVQDNWYNEVYVPHYRTSHDDRGYRDEPRRDERGNEGNGRGNGNGNNRGHGRGHQGD